MVDLVLLHLPYTLIPKCPADFTIWRHEEIDNDLWGAQDSFGSVIEDYYGFQRDSLGLVAFVLIAYPPVCLLQTGWVSNLQHS